VLDDQLAESLGVREIAARAFALERAEQKDRLEAGPVGSRRLLIVAKVRRPLVLRMPKPCETDRDNQRANVGTENGRREEGCCDVALLTDVVAVCCFS
jgi:hypothetical protein